MDQRTDELSDPKGDDIRSSERVAASSSSERREPSDRASDIEQTRADMSETIEAIQERLAPERLTDEAKDVASDVTEQAKDAALEAVDHAVQEAKAAAQEWGELARVAALEAIDHAVTKAQAALPAVGEQAKSIGQETVTHAIEEAKAAVRELGAQASATVRDATVGKVERMAHTTGQTTKSFSSRVITTVKQNPGPAALTGLGLSWLMVNGRSASTQRQTSPSVGSQMTGGGDQVQEKAGQVAGQVQEKAGQVQGVAGDVVGHVQDTASTVADQAQETAGKVADQTQQTMSQLTGQVQQLPGRFQHMLDENPLAVGIVAVALGGAAALIIPETQREHQLMGEARDNLIDRAQTGAQDVVEKVQRVTEEAGEAVGKEARAQGLSPES